MVSVSTRPFHPAQVARALLFQVLRRSMRTSALYSFRSHGEFKFPLFAVREGRKGSRSRSLCSPIGGNRNVWRENYIGAENTRGSLCIDGTFYKLVCSDAHFPSGESS